MKAIVQKAIVLCSGSLLLSCANQQLATPSGRPEVNVKPPLSRAQSVAIDTMVSDGFTIASQTSNTLVFEKDLPPTQAAIMLAGVGSAYHSHPKVVIRYAFVPQGGSVRILGTVQTSTQGPFGQMSVMDITSGKAAQQLQASLERIKSRIGQR